MTFKLKVLGMTVSFIAVCGSCFSQLASTKHLFLNTKNGKTNKALELARYKTLARQVEIIRDQWGIAHIYGKTDASVVFGLLYSQCEENFKAVERNYLNVLGRTAEVDGKKTLYTDMLLQLVEDSTDAIRDYNLSPAYFKKLLNAFADGVNYYLYTHPNEKPLVLKYFKPWYPLMFTDGSVSSTMTGGITVDELERFYKPIGKGSENSGGNPNEVLETGDSKPGEWKKFLSEGSETGSNGFAISPTKSVSGHSLLYINPHVPFYFRTEVGLESEEGLHSYGAVTWGQFFIYQGFNAHCGWMHTSSNADVADLYSEKTTTGKIPKYLYEKKWFPIKSKIINLKYSTGLKDSTIRFKTYFTQHGPVVARRDGKWISLKANNRSLSALLESWLTTKATTFKGYQSAMSLLSNGSNNTVYADDQGNTALWYGNFMPKRNPKFDWTLPVDGSIKESGWQGLHPLADIVHVYNPVTGFIQNCNATPFSSSGISSPLEQNYPKYMAPNGQNFRAINAIRLLGTPGKLNLEDLIKVGYDRYLSAFDTLMPALYKAYDLSNDSLKRILKGPVDSLKQWNKYSDTGSVATTLAVEWGSIVLQRYLDKPKTDEEGTYFTRRVGKMVRQTDPKKLIGVLLDVVHDLEKAYHRWSVPWGEVNRFQRPISNGIYDDEKPSLPSPLVSSAFGALPSFQSRRVNTIKRYGYSGNSFIAAVEFGPRLRAKSVITGGLSFDPSSSHFTDQADRFLNGRLKEVLFYKEDVIKHTVIKYHPGG